MQTGTHLQHMLARYTHACTQARMHPRTGTAIDITRKMVEMDLWDPKMTRTVRASTGMLSRQIGAREDIADRITQCDLIRKNVSTETVEIVLRMETKKRIGINSDTRIGIEV
ncbi:hypothetical protein EVAR_49954_1 [Eumeta japonica]|uniref:Uncharacterized protein n=1 Tax=Eumeta variegata TaxID=151549 RepID=A0A4C1XXG5_EUMVA|nr:hypothetical protein EVAR_49954_1 [Eumeta japonica]